MNNTRPELGTSKPTFKNPDDAFQQALDSGRLVHDHAAKNSVYLFMYMGTVDGVDLFKHRDTRAYLE